MGKFTINSFYCINCGNKSLDLPRRNSLQRGRHHRKRLWCVNCKMEINHVECKNDEDVYDFKQDFANGKYIEEAKESINFING